MVNALSVISPDMKAVTEMAFSPEFVNMLAYDREHGYSLLNSMAINDTLCGLCRSLLLSLRINSYMTSGAFMFE
jgi:hypothetical protein